MMLEILMNCRSIALMLGLVLVGLVGSVSAQTTAAKKK